jgi:hypothetical protein
MPYTTRPKPKTPAGVVRSPSRLLADTPFLPSQAGQGPSTARQQPPERRQVRSVPCGEAGRGAPTVTSCLADPVAASWFAGVGGQPVTRPRSPVAPPAAQSARQAGSASHLIGPSDYVAPMLVLLAVLALQAPPFTHTVSRVTRAELPYSWHRGCPVAPAALRRLHLTYWGFDGRAHTGALVVNRDAVGDLTRVFARLYAARFPIRRMRPIDAYRANDERSLAADNTAAFNCRYAIAPGPRRWSAHA